MIKNVYLSEVYANMTLSLFSVWLWDMFADIGLLLCIILTKINRNPHFCQDLMQYSMPVDSINVRFEFEKC